MGQLISKVAWKAEYNVGIKIIDEQHSLIFTKLNELIDMINYIPTQESVMPTINSMIEAKKFHFSTEEKYFKEFKYEGADEHISQHALFTKNLEQIQQQHNNDFLVQGYEIIQLFQKWLLDHVVNVDQAYKECFVQHGLK